MNKETFLIDNLKCGGCVKSIKNAISEIKGVNAVEVSLEDARVEIEFDENETTRLVLAEKLKSLGYPENGTGNILDKAKSYVSCAVGKFS